jgi:hypothetical protein
MSDLSEVLFSRIRHNFERSLASGTIQIISEHPPERFFIIVDKTSVSYSKGMARDPTSTIWMRHNLLLDLLLEGHCYDPRNVRFASRLSVSGNFELAHAVLDLVKHPTPSTLALLAEAKQISRNEHVESIVRLSDPDINCLCELMVTFRPVVATRLLDHWKVWNWNPGILHTNFGESEIAPFLPLAMRDFVASMLTPTRSHAVSTLRYTGGVSLPSFLCQYFPPPRMLEGFVDSPQLWLGTANASEKPVTGLHCDCRHGLLCQVFGKKRVILYSPDQENLVYAYRAFNTHRPCWTGPDKPDYDNYPLFRQAKALDVILKPGEALFIPAGWFHCVFGLEPVMSISMAVSGHPSRARYPQDAAPQLSAYS